jgi:hypothetical protein
MWVIKHKNPLTKKIGKKGVKIKNTIALPKSSLGLTGLMNKIFCKNNIFLPSLNIAISHAINLPFQSFKQFENAGAGLGLLWH